MGVSSRVLLSARDGNEHLLDVQKKISRAPLLNAFWCLLCKMYPHNRACRIEEMTLSHALTTSLLRNNKALNQDRCQMPMLFSIPLARCHLLLSSIFSPEPAGVKCSIDLRVSHYRRKINYLPKSRTGRRFPPISMAFLWPEARPL